MGNQPLEMYLKGNPETGAILEGSWRKPCTGLLADARDAGNEQWNDPNINHPTGGFLQGDQKPGFIPFLIPYLSHRSQVPPHPRVYFLLRHVGFGSFFGSFSK